MTGSHREQHAMTRVDVATGIPFDEFINAFEKAAPPMDQAAMERIVAAGGDWDDVRASPDPQPARASASEMARPIPRPPPVTRATFVWSLCMVTSFSAEPLSCRNFIKQLVKRYHNQKLPSAEIRRHAEIRRQDTYSL